MTSSVATLTVNLAVPDSFSPDRMIKSGRLRCNRTGRFLVGGGFTTLAGQSLAYMGRLNTNGTLDTTFTPTITRWAFDLG